jgi:antirestriction protein ArdC
MKFYGKAQQVADKVIEAMKNGKLPEAMAQVLVEPILAKDAPAINWSLRNRFILAIDGHTDARGFKQWNKIERKVKKGEKSSYILVPLMRKLEKKDIENPENIASGDRGKENKENEDSILWGYKAVPVFGYNQTEGKEIPEYKEQSKFIDGLPLLEVAENWGLEVKAVPFLGKFLGKYNHDKSIMLASENIKVWLHELMHAADFKAGGIKEGKDKEIMEKEIVADFGACVLACMLGIERDADMGETYKYCNVFAKENKTDLFVVIQKLMKRTCEAIELIMQNAEKTSLPAA